MPACSRRSGGDLADVAGEDAPGNVGDEIEAGAGLVAALLDDFDDRRQPAGTPDLVGQTADLGGDGVAELLVEQHVGRIGDVEDEEDREDREDRDIDRRELEGGGADDLTERRH